MAFKLQRGPRLVLPNGQVGPYSWETQNQTPSSVKRIKPLDLFASSTPRTVYETGYANVVYPAFKYPNQPDYPGFLTAGQEANFSWTGELNECRMKLANKIKAQNVNLAQAMIEFRQSANLFLTLAEDLYSGYRMLRRGELSRIGRKLGVLEGGPKDPLFSKKWIEYQFGLVPLVSDLQGLCDSLALGLRDGTYLQATQTVSGRHQTYSRSLRDPVGNGTLQHFEREDFSVRMKARYKIQNAKVKDVARFGFFNIPALAWEMVPFSFVVDWAIPVGGWLSSLDALHGVSELVYQQGTYTRRSIQRNSTNGGPTASSYSRYKARSQTLSGLPIGFPTYKPSDSLVKVLTGAALLRLIRS